MLPVLVASQVQRQFGQTTALACADLKVHQGELLALLGPNGAGKTTLIRAIAGRLKIDSGSIEVCGQTQTPGGNREISMKLGVIPQDLAIYESLKASENLRLFGRIFGVADAELSERVQWALDWTGLTDRDSSLVKTYSGGMKRRLNIACGMMHRPEVILLDEPTVGVDPQSRERIWEMLQALKAEGIATVLTTHQLDEAQQVADRIVIIDEGRTIADGTFQELLETLPDRATKISLSLSAQPETLPENCTLDDHGRVTVHVSDLGTGLVRVLNELTSSGVSVTDISAVSPNLQAVFLHHTGRQLRE